MFSNDRIHFIKTSMCVTLTLYTIFSLNLLPFVWLQLCALFPICSFLMYLFVIPAPLNKLSTFYCYVCSLFYFICLFFCVNSFLLLYFILQFFFLILESNALFVYFQSFWLLSKFHGVSDCSFVSKPSLTCNPLYSKEGHFSLPNFSCPGGT